MFVVPLSCEDRISRGEKTVFTALTNKCFQFDFKEVY